MDATDIIEAFGGDVALAQTVGLGRTGVYTWHKRGIPHGRCLELAELAKKRGLRRITIEVLLTSKPRDKNAPEPELSATSVIELLGGSAVLAAALGKSRRTVARWHKAGLPAELLHEIAAVARRQGRKSITVKALIQARPPTPAAPPSELGLSTAA